jgi:hypothetical protein
MAPDSLPDPIAAATRVADVLDRIGVTYVIGGSFASSVHGEPRSTNDVDMVADLHDADVDAFIEGIGSGCYVSRDTMIDAVRTGGTFNVIEISSAMKIDIFVAGSDAFDRERLRRRVGITFSSGPQATTLFVDTAEDTILRKLEWYRRGGESSERQWRDVMGIVNAQRSNLDRTFLRDWATALGVADLVERVLE